MTSRISIIEIKYTQRTQFCNVDTLATSSYNLCNTTIPWAEITQRQLESK